MKRSQLVEILNKLPDIDVRCIGDMNFTHISFLNTVNIDNEEYILISQEFGVCDTPLPDEKWFQYVKAGDVYSVKGTDILVEKRT